MSAPVSSAEPLEDLVNQCYMFSKMSCVELTIRKDWSRLRDFKIKA